jgi:hypothetical protein
VKLSDAPRFLTVEELITEVARFTYRPGWKLSVYVHPWEGPFLRIRANVVNAYDSSADLIELRINAPIPPMRDTEAFDHWLLWRLGMVELHEAREFLHRDGVVLIDPHDPVEPDEVT